MEIRSSLQTTKGTKFFKFSTYIIHQAHKKKSKNLQSIAYSEIKLC